MPPRFTPRCLIGKPPSRELAKEKDFESKAYHLRPVHKPSWLSAARSQFADPCRERMGCTVHRHGSIGRGQIAVRRALVYPLTAHALSTSRGAPKAPLRAIQSVVSGVVSALAAR